MYTDVEQTRDGRGKQSPEVGGRRMPLPPLQKVASSNGHALPHREVTEDTPPDMLEGRMELSVVLPSGAAVKMNVERSTPVMDLLVQVTTSNQINPGGHVVQVMNERGRDVLHYKSSTPIGALDTKTIYIVPKNRLNDGPVKKKKKAPTMSANQPFEQTVRLQVNLPRNQLAVLRVSPKTPLADVLRQVCEEKALEHAKYELRHPVNVDERLRLGCSLSDYKLQEVTLVAANKPTTTAVSSADLVALHKDEDGCKKGIFMYKKSRSSMGESSVSSDSLGDRSSRGVSPARSDDSTGLSVSPTNVHPPSTVSVQPPPRHKKRLAPKPPVVNGKASSQAASPVASELSPSTSASSSAPECVPGALPQPCDQPAISHSRHSSDSSGYHEPSVLSESPESNVVSSSAIESPTNTMVKQKTSTPTRKSPVNSVPRSVSTLTSASSLSTIPSASNLTSAISASNMSIASAVRKRKAPPPPVRKNQETQLKKEVIREESAKQDSETGRSTDVVRTDVGSAGVANAVAEAVKCNGEVSEDCSAVVADVPSGSTDTSQSAVSSGAPSPDNVSSADVSPISPKDAGFKQPSSPLPRTLTPTSHRASMISGTPADGAPDVVQLQPALPEAQSQPSACNKYSDQLGPVLAHGILTRRKKKHPPPRPHSMTEKKSSAETGSVTVNPVVSLDKININPLSKKPLCMPDKSSRHSNPSNHGSSTNISAKENIQVSKLQMPRETEASHDTDTNQLSLPVPSFKMATASSTVHKPVTRPRSMLVDSGSSRSANVSPQNPYSKVDHDRKTTTSKDNISFSFGRKNKPSNNYIEFTEDTSSNVDDLDLNESEWGMFATKAELDTSESSATNRAFNLDIKKEIGEENLVKESEEERIISGKNKPVKTSKSSVMNRAVISKDSSVLKNEIDKKNLELVTESAEDKMKPVKESEDKATPDKKKPVKPSLNPSTPKKQPAPLPPSKSVPAPKVESSPKVQTEKNKSATSNSVDIIQKPDSTRHMLKNIMAFSCEAYRKEQVTVSSHNEHAEDGEALSENTDQLMGIPGNEIQDYNTLSGSSADNKPQPASNIQGTAANKESSVLTGNKSTNNRDNTHSDHIPNTSFLFQNQEMAPEVKPSLVTMPPVSKHQSHTPQPSPHSVISPVHGVPDVTCTVSSSESDILPLSKQTESFQSKTPNTVPAVGLPPDVYMYKGVKHIILDEKEKTPYSVSTRNSATILSAQPSSGENLYTFDTLVCDLNKAGKLSHGQNGADLKDGRFCSKQQPDSDTKTNSISASSESSYPFESHFSHPKLPHQTPPHKHRTNSKDRKLNHKNKGASHRTAVPASHTRIDFGASGYSKTSGTNCLQENDSRPIGGFPLSRWRNMESLVPKPSTDDMSPLSGDRGPGSGIKTDVVQEQYEKSSQENESTESSDICLEKTEDAREKSEPSAEKLILAQDHKEPLAPSRTTKRAGVLRKLSVSSVSSSSSTTSGDSRKDAADVEQESVKQQQQHEITKCRADSNVEESCATIDFGPESASDHSGEDQTRDGAQSPFSWEYNLPDPPTPFRDGHSKEEMLSVEYDRSAVVCLPDLTISDAINGDIIGELHPERSYYDIIVERYNQIKCILNNGDTIPPPLPDTQPPSSSEDEGTQLRWRRSLVEGSATESDADSVSQQETGRPNNNSSVISNFSISTYVNRIEEEQSYDKKLVKSESFSYQSRPKLDKPVSKAESFSLQNHSDRFDKKVVPAETLEEEREVQIRESSNASQPSAPSGVFRRSVLNSQPWIVKKLPTVERAVSSDDSMAMSLPTRNLPGSRHEAFGDVRATSMQDLATASEGGDFTVAAGGSGDGPAAEPLRKTCSELDISTGESSMHAMEQEQLQEEFSKLQKQFLQWQQQLINNQGVLQTKVAPHVNTTQPAAVPFQSLEMIKELLPHVSQSLGDLSGNMNQDTVDKRTTQPVDQDYALRSRSLPHPRLSQSVVDIDMTTDAEIQTRTLDRTPSQKRYTYVGPPAINLGSWCERPRSSVELKEDKDYKTGSGAIVGRMYSSVPRRDNVPENEHKINKFQAPKPYEVKSNVGIKKLDFRLPQEKSKVTKMDVQKKETEDTVQLKYKMADSVVKAESLKQSRGELLVGNRRPSASSETEFAGAEGNVDIVSTDGRHSAKTTKVMPRTVTKVNITDTHDTNPTSFYHGTSQFKQTEVRSPAENAASEIYFFGNKPGKSSGVSQTDVPSTVKKVATNTSNGYPPSHTHFSGYSAAPPASVATLTQSKEGKSGGKYTSVITLGSDSQTRVKPVTVIPMNKKDSGVVKAGTVRHIPVVMGFKQPDLQKRPSKPPPEPKVANTVNEHAPSNTNDLYREKTVTKVETSQPPRSSSVPPPQPKKISVVPLVAAETAKTVKVSEAAPSAASIPPPPPMGNFVQLKPANRTAGGKRIVPPKNVTKLDPREELMVAIRETGQSSLKKTGLLHS